MTPIRIRDIEPGASFLTPLTKRIGIRVSNEPPEHGKGGVEVSLSPLGEGIVEDKTLHDDVKVLPWKGVVH